MNKIHIRHHVNELKKITLEPYQNQIDLNHLYVQLKIFYITVNRLEKYIGYKGISKVDELSFFYKLNHLVYVLEKKNIQDIIHLRGINGDIYNVLNYLFMTYKKDNTKIKKIIKFIDDNFDYIQTP